MQNQVASVALAAVLAGVCLPVAGSDSTPPGAPAVELASSQLWVTDELTGFQSPTGNVGCYIDPDMVRCDIAERNWAPPPRPADCHPNLNSGQGLQVTADGVASVVCAGDTALGYGEFLPYGDAIQSGSLQCDSTEAAMVCRDRTSGHGFSLSREGYELF